MNLQRRDEIRALIVDQNIEDPQALTDCRNALAELLAHIDTLEQTAAERVIADGSRGPTLGYTGDGSAWVPPVEVQAVVVPELDADSIHPLIQWAPGFRVKMKETAQAINAWFRENSRAIPADRVLGEGMVQLSKSELHRFAEYWGYQRLHEDNVCTSDDEAIQSLDALRANQGGTAT